MIKFLVTDLDGTLFDRHKETIFDLPEDTIEALDMAKEHGIRVVPCSGRTYPYSLRLYELYDLGTPILCAGLNGATIYHDGIKEEYPLQTNDVLTLLEEAKKYPDTWKNIQAQNDYNLRIYLDPTKDPAPRYRKESGKAKCSEVANCTLEEYLREGKPVLKFSLISPTKEASSFLEDMYTRKYGANFAIARSSDVFLEITSPKATKGAFVEYLCRTFDLRADEVAVIGDSGNDISMFAYSNYSFAMANGSKEAKDAAKYVVASIKECIEFILKVNGRED